MSKTTQPPAKVTFFQKSRKAFAAGVGSAIGGVGTACTAIAATGSFTPEQLPNDVWIIAIAAVGGFALGFGPAWVATNAVG